MSVHRLVWHIYNRLNVLGVFGAMDDGAARRENLIALSQHAEKFESNGYRGLFAFVTQLRRLLEQDQAPATRGPACLLYTSSRSDRAAAKAADRLPGERIRITISSGRQGRRVPSLSVTG